MKHITLLRTRSFGLIIFVLIAVSMFIGNPEFVSARENTGINAGKGAPPPSINAACPGATAQSDLAVNNVRCRILMGDMWWDLDNGVYEIPKGSGTHSIFAGSLWIGGIDEGGQLKVAAQTYRQTGNDFWPGPLDTTNASVDLDVCAQYDRHFRITRKEVEVFVATGASTPAISAWPGNGDQSKGQANYLAPFFDNDGDGRYNPSAGDYPGYDLVSGDNYGDCQQVNCIPVDQLFGDETIWWVFNDKGDIHGETKSKEGIGLEIRAQAFGFFTDDEINNMTFYNYRIFNRSTFKLDSCYFGVWCDSDLGCYTDDYVGCDVKRGLGYTYNGDEVDEIACESKGYGVNPPAVGIDFFRGPIADIGDGKDNNRDCQTDEACEQIIMSGFLYYNNTNGVPYGNPSGATHFYNYLRMKWGDGVPVTYGGNGYNTGGPVCNFMYPGSPTTDEHNWGIGGNCSTSSTLAGWDEVTVGNPPEDRRMLQSAGPFTLLPGAVNVITTGVVWARATSGGAQASVKLLKVVDDKAQALFDNCFKVLDGPSAPDVTVQELDKELILYLSNPDPNSNNFNENYTEFDPLIFLTDSIGNACTTVDKYYHFEGYKIYQLKSATVSANDLEDPNNARLVYQCDLKNNISRIINYEFDQSLGAGVPKEKVDGANAGLSHSVKITTDAFAAGSPRLVNHKTYYFMAVAYGFNEFKKYQQDIPPSGDICDKDIPAYTGQKKPYKQGRKNILVYSAIPHIPTPYTGGTETHGEYGNGPRITRVEGNGNGGMNLEFTSSTVAAILASSEGRVKTPTYEYGKGPVNIKIVDPLNVPDGHNFTLKFDTAASIRYNSSVGAFQVGDVITGAASGATCVITANNGFVMYINKIVGAFVNGETIKGSVSGATAKIGSFNKGTTKLNSANKHLIDNSTWALTNTTTGEVIYSDQTITAVNEQLIMKWGLSVSIEQAADPGIAVNTDNGFISASMTFADPSKKWLTGLADREGAFNSNWIRSGTVTTGNHTDYIGIDSIQMYEGILGGTWAPYRLCATSDVSVGFLKGGTNPANKYYTGPGYRDNQMSKADMKNLSSVNIVLTGDKSKWTRSVVLEMSEDSAYSVNTSGAAKKARKHDPRCAPSVDKNGNRATIGSGASTNPNNANYISDQGMGWFPGYAVNLETGERLNIAFGENSALTKLAGKAVINYNLRGTLAYGSLKGGPFKKGEKISDYLSPVLTATAVVAEDNGSNSMKVESMSETISPQDVITGGTSGAKAVVSSFTSTKFQVGETVTGGTSGAKGIIAADMNSTSVMVINTVSGTFAAAEEITGGTSGAMAGIITYSAYNFDQNGADMLWNPTSKTVGEVPWAAGVSNPVYGGQHYIYVFGHNREIDPPGSPSPNETYAVPRYDAGKYLDSALKANVGNTNYSPAGSIFRDAMWVSIPLLAPLHSALESEVTIRLRVTKSYKPGYSPAFIRNGLSIIYTDTAAASLNKNLPTYTFSTEGIATHTSESELATEALDLIKVVPNPYYAYSTYETSSLDNRVKITNLPEQCTVSIYNLGGTLIRRFSKGETSVIHSAFSSVVTSSAGSIVIKSWDGSLDWDLKNTVGIPISSGVYIIHVEVPEVGEKIVKWFGVMRPIDLDSF